MTLSIVTLAVIVAVPSAFAVTVILEPLFAETLAIFESLLTQEIVPLPL